MDKRRYPNNCDQWSSSRWSVLSWTEKKGLSVLLITYPISHVTIKHHDYEEDARSSVPTDWPVMWGTHAAEGRKLTEKKINNLSMRLRLQKVNSLT